MQKKLLAILTILFLIVLLTWIALSHATSGGIKPSSTKLNVVASFYPVAEFSRAVGGSLVNVITVTPAGVEPHDYEPTAQQIASVYQSQIFLYNGGGVDAWADRISADVSSHGISVVELGKSIAVVAPAQGSEDPSAAFDPHFWLDPVLAEKEIAIIEKTFETKDPFHASDYQKNANAYIAKLSALDASYRNGLASCKMRTIVTSHAAFAYLGAEYNLNVIPISGLSPDEEPSAGRLAQIAMLAKQQNIKYIFFETLVSPKLADTLAQEIGAQTLVFNPLEGVSDADQAAGKNYLTVMQDNLNNLKTGLLCP